VSALERVVCPRTGEAFGFSLSSFGGEGWGEEAVFSKIGY